MIDGPSLDGAEDNAGLNLGSHHSSSPFAAECGSRGGRISGKSPCTL